MDDISNEYYFVPLGREPGGFLDRLELPPDADDKAVGSAERDYRKSLETEFKQGRKALRESLREKDITQEEFDAKVKDLEAVQTAGLAELNELKSRHEKVLADRRVAAQQGRPVQSTAWDDLFARSCNGGASPADAYLAILKLPLDTDKAVAAQAERAYRQKLKRECKQQRAALKKRLEEKEIAREEFDAEVDKLLATERESLARLNEAQQQHEEGGLWRDLARKDGELLWETLLNLRDLPQVDPQRITEIADHWISNGAASREVTGNSSDDRYKDLLADFELLTKEEHWQRLEWLKRVQERATHRLQAELREKTQRQEMTEKDAKLALAEQRKRHETERSQYTQRFDQLQEAVKKNEASRSPQSRPRKSQQRSRNRYFEDRTPGLATLVDLVDERNLMQLMTADWLWAELQYTNRDCWRKTIEDWADEIVELGPRLRLDPVAKRGRKRGEPPEFPALCRPPDRSVDHLEAKELGEIGQEPDRKGAFRGQKDPLFEAFLQAMLEAKLASDSDGEEEAKPSGKKTPDGKGKASRKVTLPIEKLLELLEKKAKAAGAASDDSPSDPADKRRRQRKSRKR